MCQFLEEKGHEDKKKWGSIKRYILGTVQETEVCEGKVYICDTLLKMQNRGESSRFKI